METSTQSDGSSGAGEKNSLGHTTDRTENKAHGERNEPKGDGDKIFEALGKTVSKLNSKNILELVRRFKSTSVEELDLPPALANAVRTVIRKLQGKIEDLQELALETKDLALRGGHAVSEKVANSLDLPSQEDIRLLEERIRELEKENEQLKKLLTKQKTVSKRKTLSKAKAKAKAKSKIKARAKS